MYDSHKSEINNELRVRKVALILTMLHLHARTHVDVCRDDVELLHLGIVQCSYIYMSHVSMLL